MSAKEECIEIKQEELDQLFEWCDNITIRCGDDNWTPTVSELESSVILAYRDIANQRRNCGPEADSELIKKQKKILLFLLWIVETYTGNLDKSVDSYIQNFLKGRLVVVD